MDSKITEETSERAIIATLASVKIVVLYMQLHNLGCPVPYIADMKTESEYTEYADYLRLLEEEAMLNFSDIKSLLPTTRDDL